MAVDPKRPLSYSHSRAHSYNFAHAYALAPTDLKLPNAANKGKHRDSDDFRFGSWDFVPLLEPRRPPVQWTSSSLIITAHGTEPRVGGLHFPSNRHFLLPDPPAISAAPASYEPPAIISSSSRDDWIFAYFPGIDVDSVGCFWKKSCAVDDWTVKEWWTFARGDGVVAARWLNPEREWSSSDSGTSVRLPPLGPFIPSLYPVLVAVTETRLCDVFYFHPRTEKMHMLSASLARRSVSRQGRERPVGERVDGPQGLGRCVHAAIGLGYDESSILISTSSSFVPSASTEMGSQASTDMNLSLSVPSSQGPEVTSNWEMWRDEHIIEICEVNILVEGFFLVLTTTPLPSIRDFSQSGRCLISMTFAPSLITPNNQAPFPSTPTQTHRRVTPQSSPATIPAYVSQSPGRSVLRSPVKGAAVKPPIEKVKARPSGNLFLLCTTLEHGQFASVPSSEVALYVFWRNPADPQTWYFRRASHLSMPSSVVVYLSPSSPVNTTQHTSALLGVLNHEGQVVKRKGEQYLNVGKLQVLRLPDLQTDDNWEPVDLLCPIGPYGVELPFSFAVSPNRALVCAIPASLLLSFSTNVSVFIHQHPTRAVQSGQDHGTMSRAPKQPVSFIDIALRKRVAPGDVIGSQYTNNVPLPVIEEVLATVLLGFETNFGTTNMWINQIIGVAIEIFRRRSLFVSSGSEINDLTSRYQTGLEICSLSACNIIWEDAFGTREYDPNAIWNLTSLSGYFMEDFLEKLLRDCVQFASEISLGEGLFGLTYAAEPLAAPSPEKDGGDSSVQTSLHLSSSLLHLVHPYALDLLHSFVQHVRRFRGFLGSNMRVEEHLQVAREILIDCIDSSPIDLEALDRVLLEIKTEVKAYAEHHPDLARRCLVALKPSAEYTPLLRKIISKLMQAQVADKLALFIRPDSLVDGTLGLSGSTPGKMWERDVITKRYLADQSQIIQCLRCGGKSEISTKPISMQGHTSVHWERWERIWYERCICGGLWSSKV